MPAAIFLSHSKSDIKLLTQLAKRLGISTKKLTKTETEDFALGYVMDTGKASEFIDVEEFKNHLRK